jgi:aspartyl-tRNA(Asn)/glutamyl-tRNA(Gln) amidotransferase subunit B
MLIDEAIADNPKQVEQYRAGKTTLAGFFVGQVMRASKGQANPALLNELVTKKMEKYREQGIGNKEQVTGTGL